MKGCDDFLFSITTVSDVRSQAAAEEDFFSVYTCTVSHGLPLDVPDDLTCSTTFLGKY